MQEAKGLSLLPNWAYSVALARYHLARRSQAKRAAAARNRLELSATAGGKQQRDSPSSSSSASASASTEQLDQRLATPDAADMAVRHDLCRGRNYN